MRAAVVGQDRDWLRIALGEAERAGRDAMLRRRAPEIPNLQRGLVLVVKELHLPALRSGAPAGENEENQDWPHSAYGFISHQSNRTQAGNTRANQNLAPARGLVQQAQAT